MWRVLLVDDESHIRHFYSEELSGDGYEVITLNSGHRLLQRICSIQPDLVVLDIRLGDGWDGLDLLQDIKNRFFDLPVILCTAYDTFKYDLRSAASDSYVVKSENLSELKEKIKTAIQKIPPSLHTGEILTACEGIHKQQHQPIQAIPINGRYTNSWE